MTTFKDKYSQIAGSITPFNIDYYYISKLDCQVPQKDGDVDVYEGRLKQGVIAHFPRAVYHVHYINAAGRLLKRLSGKLRARN
jgi:hypothetical protein